MLENINTAILDVKGLDSLFTTTKNNNISNNDKDFLNCLKKAKSNVLKSDKGNSLPKDLKLGKTEEKREVSKNKTTKDKDNILDVEENFEDLECINGQILSLIVNLMALSEKDETVNMEELEEECIQLLQALEPYVMSMENELNNNVVQNFSKEDIELIQTVFDNLTEIKDLILDSENDFEKQLNQNIVSEIERQVLEFEQKLEPIMNKIVTKEAKNELILEVDNQENQEELDDTKPFSTDEETIFETNETPVIKGEEKTEVAEEKLEEHEFNMEESFEEPPIINTKSEQNFDGKVDKIQSKEVEIPKDEVLKQIIDKGKAIISDEKSEIRIKLKPEILGELVLKIELEKGVVVAKVLVDNYRVKELLETNIYQLKEGLEEQGVEIKTFEVQVGSNSDFEKENRQNTFKNGKNKKVKIKKLDLDDLNVYEENTVSYSPSTVNESKLDLMA